MEEVIRKWADAFCAGDGPAVTALSTEDFILLPQSSPTLTKKPGELLMVLSMEIHHRDIFSTFLK